MLSSQMLTAQIENIKVGENTTINKLYTGLYAKTLIPIDSLEWSNDVSYRLGVLATHRLNKTFAISTQGAFQIESGSDFTSIADFELVTTVTDNWQIRLGSLTTPITFIRPNPITWQSQSETYAQTRILVQRPGVLSTYTFNKDWTVTYGVHNQNDQWAHHMRLDVFDFMLGGYVQQDGAYFGVVDYRAEKGRGVVNYSSLENEWAASYFQNISERYTAYIDINYLTELQESTVFRLGIRSYYLSKKWHLKGFLALEYDFSAELFSAELFIHLN